MVRIGVALGDHLICTPLIKHLKQQGNEIYFLGGEAAQVLAKNNPYIDKFIYYKENTVEISQLDEFIKSTAAAYECEKVINLSGSLENTLLIHPAQPQYNNTKEERIAQCNKNVYDYCAEFAGYPELKGQIPELYPDEETEDEISTYIKNVKGNDGIVILWSLTGSGSHKAWPWYSYVWNDLIKKYKNVKIISVGDEACRILEVAMKDHPRYIPKSGKWKIMESMVATKYVDLVVGPDTGVMHAAGCFDTPKITILGHGTKLHTAGNFKNDYSIESDIDKAPCAPCYRLIYNAGVQCPIDEEESGAPICMALGQSREKVRDHVFKVIDEVILCKK